jgi:DNA replication protein
MSDRPGDVLLPAGLLDDVLSRVQDLAEMKAVMFVLQAAARGGTPGVWFDDLLETRIVQAVVGTDSPRPSEDRLRQALDRAVANGFLFRVVAGGGRTCYLPVSEGNRALLGRMRAGEAGAPELLGLDPDTPAAIYRPNIYAVYEQHIGSLTPLVAEQLRSAERAYPRGWIEEAIITAARYNRRSWRYIETVLLRWEETGAPHGDVGTV